MDRQLILNKVTHHLLTQKKPGRASDGSCQYQTFDGLKCAIGILISPEHFRAELNQCGTVRELPVLNAVVKSLELDAPTKEDVQFLRDLQVVHDGHHPVDWEAELKILANDYKLSWDSVELYRRNNSAL